MNNFQIDDEMRELLESFFVETHELLDALDQDLMRLEHEPHNMDLLNSIFRSFHTIKGTSSFMGLEQMTELTHHAEDLLNKLRRSELVVTTVVVDTLLEVYDILGRLLSSVERNTGETIDFTDTLKKISACSNGDTGAGAEESSDTSAAEPDSTAATASAVEQGSAMDSILTQHGSASATEEFTEEELLLVAQAFNEVNSSLRPTQTDAAAGKSEAADSKPDTAAAKASTPPKKPDTGKSDPTQDSTTDADGSLVVSQRTVVRNTQSRKNEEEPPIEIKAEPQQRAAAEATLRVDVQRLEALMDLSGELVLGRNRLAQITERLMHQMEENELVQELMKTSAEINYITSELQSAIMKTRMVPIGKLYQKAPRMIRELSREFNKEIELIIQGEETEVDRSIIEEIGDPLVHMIRNSCDHGIERPEDREKAGKPRKGTICLTAEHEGNHIVIRIMDDGRGMNAEVLKNKALEKGIITREQAAQMGEQEAFNLIFAAGFSTAEKVTNVSGRGVGMDVVRTNIQKLKGTIHIESQVGRGSVFTIKLPLTLAIIQGLLIRIREEIYALPLSSVIEVVSSDDNQISTVHQSEVIRIRDQVYPLLRLSSLLKIPQKPDAEREGGYVVIIGLAEQRIGLVVDELLGQKEIVVKSLGDYLEEVRGIAGSTILGDGRVIMILDIGDVFHSAYHTGAIRRHALAD